MQANSYIIQNSHEKEHMHIQCQCVWSFVSEVSVVPLDSIIVELPYTYESHLKWPPIIRFSLLSYIELSLDIEGHKSRRHCQNIDIICLVLE